MYTPSAIAITVTTANSIHATALLLSFPSPLSPFASVVTGTVVSVGVVVVSGVVSPGSVVLSGTVVLFGVVSLGLVVVLGVVVAAGFLYPQVSQTLSFP